MACGCSARKARRRARCGASGKRRNVADGRHRPPLRGRGLWAWRASGLLCVAPLRPAKRSYSKTKCPSSERVNIIQIDSRVSCQTRSVQGGSTGQGHNAFRGSDHDVACITPTKGGRGDLPPIFYRRQQPGDARSSSTRQSVSISAASARSRTPTGSSADAHA